MSNKGHLVDWGFQSLIAGTHTNPAAAFSHIEFCIECKARFGLLLCGLEMASVANLVQSFLAARRYYTKARGCPDFETLCELGRTKTMSDHVKSCLFCRTIWAAYVGSGFEAKGAPRAKSGARTGGAPDVDPMMPTAGVGNANFIPVDGGLPQAVGDPEGGAHSISVYPDSAEGSGAAEYVGGDFGE